MIKDILNQWKEQQQKKNEIHEKKITMENLLKNIAILQAQENVEQVLNPFEKNLSGLEELLFNVLGIRKIPIQTEHITGFINEKGYLSSTDFKLMYDSPNSFTIQFLNKSVYFHKNGGTQIKLKFTKKHVIIEFWHNRLYNSSSYYLVIELIDFEQNLTLYLEKIDGTDTARFSND